MAPTKNKKRRREENFDKYIFKLLKQVHPNTKISKKSIKTMDHLVRDIFERIAVESSQLSRNKKCSTITSRDIQTAVRLVLPVQLANVAVSAGTKAVVKYITSK